VYFVINPARLYYNGPGAFVKPLPVLLGAVPERRPTQISKRSTPAGLQNQETFMCGVMLGGTLSRGSSIGVGTQAESD
jgi:hypothetical protein